jgi:hypothetical protein
MRLGKRDIPGMNIQGQPSFAIKEPLLTQTEAAAVLHVEPRTLESRASFATHAGASATGWKIFVNGLVRRRSKQDRDASGKTLRTGVCPGAFSLWPLGPHRAESVQSPLAVHPMLFSTAKQTAGV